MHPSVFELSYRNFYIILYKNHTSLNTTGHSESLNLGTGGLSSPQCSREYQGPQAMVCPKSRELISLSLGPTAEIICLLLWTSFQHFVLPLIHRLNQTDANNFRAISVLCHSDGRGCNGVTITIILFQFSPIHLEDLLEMNYSSFPP